MRIDLFLVQNFRGFPIRDFVFHPEFNLVIGENGTGKTSVLDALAVAAGSWFLGLRGYKSPQIRPEGVRLQGREGVEWEQSFLCGVEAFGVVQERYISWARTREGPGRRTTSRYAYEIKDLAKATERAVQAGENIDLPLISYYGADRIRNVHVKQSKLREPASNVSERHRSRFEPYRNSVNPRRSVAAVVETIARQFWRSSLQGRRDMGAIAVVLEALARNAQGVQEIRFEWEIGEFSFRFANDQRLPFRKLSDGQRCLLALVGDIAQQAATLNPHLGKRVLAETRGVVLIDELELHLHPTWQRRVIENLRTTFPRIQFFCTTNSPFLIQSLRSGDELVMLDGQPTAQLANLSVDEIARGIQGVPDTSVSERYADMRRIAKHYLETLEEAAMSPEEKLADYKQRLADDIAPYADNPAFQAFLEMKRVARLGE